MVEIPAGIVILKHPSAVEIRLEYLCQGFCVRIERQHGDVDLIIGCYHGIIGVLGKPGVILSVLADGIDTVIFCGILCHGAVVSDDLLAGVIIYHRKVFAVRRGVIYAVNGDYIGDGLRG